MRKNTMPHTVPNKWHHSSFWRAFAVTLFFVTFASGLFWLDFFRSYNAEVTIVVIAQSTVEQPSEIAQTMRGLSQTLSFYNRLLADNDLIDDDFVGYTPDARKEKWQQLVSLTLQDGGGMLIIRAQGDTPEKSKRLASQTAQTLFSVAGLYYDVKTGVDMRVVDGPIVSYSMDTPWSFIGISLLTSISLTTCFFFLLRILPEWMGMRTKGRETIPSLETSSENEYLARRAYPEFDTDTTNVFIDPKKFIPEKPHTLSFEEQQWKQELSENLVQEKSKDEEWQEKSFQAEGGSLDERNLPVADEDALPFTFETVSEEGVVHTEMTVPSEAVPFETLKSDINHEKQTQEERIAPTISLEPTEPSEPTQEEYRRRLNALLAHIEK